MSCFSMFHVLCKKSHFPFSLPSKTEPFTHQRKAASRLQKHFLHVIFSSKFQELQGVAKTREYWVASSSLLLLCGPIDPICCLRKQKSKETIAQKKSNKFQVIFAFYAFQFLLCKWTKILLFSYESFLHSFGVSDIFKQVPCPAGNILPW